WVHAIQRRLTQKTLEGDLFIYGDDGGLLIAVEGFACQLLAGTRDAASDRQIGEWLYGVSWQEQPLAGSGSPPAPLDAAPPLSAVPHRGRRNDGDGCGRRGLAIWRLFLSSGAAAIGWLRR